VLSSSLFKKIADISSEEKTIWCGKGKELITINWDIKLVRKSVLYQPSIFNYTS